METTVIRKQTINSQVVIRKHHAPSSVLIPFVLWDKISASNRRELPRYLSILCDRYRLLFQSTGYLGRNPLRITFQEAGQSLVRRSYRPYERSYQELKSLSLTHGVSINYLIALMLYWEDLGIARRIIRQFWKGAKIPNLSELSFQRVLDIKGNYIRLSSLSLPGRFILNSAQGFPKWEPS